MFVFFFFHSKLRFSQSRFWSFPKERFTFFMSFPAVMFVSCSGGWSFPKVVFDVKTCTTELSLPVPNKLKVI